MSNLIINDPVYGFLSIPRGLLCELVAHPYFQRLARIRQLGLGGVVYPGADHSRKQHSLGALHLMQEAFRSLAEKGHFLFDSEVEATEAAILLHDIGHGPFSHVLERTIIRGISHEDLTLLMMERMNEAVHGELSLAIRVFRGDHPTRFLHELISSQLDVDRMDYLCRDSFYTGVREGNIGAARIIKSLDIVDDRLVVSHKGLLSVENYLMTRRLMYWQVYLHKTVVAAGEMLRAILRRAKWLAQSGDTLFASPALDFFLRHDVGLTDFRNDPSLLDRYARLDDSDILCALKVWTEHKDSILSRLCRGFIDRRLFKVDVYEGTPPAEAVEVLKEAICRQEQVSPSDAHYYYSLQEVRTEMYSATAEGIHLQLPDGTVHDIAEVSHLIRSEERDEAERKTYVCHLPLVE